MILYGNQTGYLFKQVLVFIPLSIQFCLFFSDFPSHFIDRHSQLSNFVIWIDINRFIVLSLCDQPGLINEIGDGFVYKSQDKNKNDRGSDQEH